LRRALYDPFTKRINRPFTNLRHTEHLIGDTAMAHDDRRSTLARRSGEDRRSGKDLRSKAEQRSLGERRSGKDRRAGRERRANAAPFVTGDQR
jgi:hypothetical protein